MNLVANWRQAWRMASVQFMAAAGVLQVVWDQNPEAVKAVVPASWVPYITAGLMVAGIVGRIVKQPAVSGPPQ